MSEATAIRADAELRLTELHNVKAALWADRHDPLCAEELSMIDSQIRAAMDALTADGGNPVGHGSS